MGRVARWIYPFWLKKYRKDQFEILRKFSFVEKIDVLTGIRFFVRTAMYGLQPASIVFATELTRYPDIPKSQIFT